MNQNAVDTIADRIEAKINEPDDLPTATKDAIRAIAELWDIAPALARRIEKGLIELANQ